MTTPRNEPPPISWDDLLAAISPQPPSPSERLRNALAAIAELQAAGQISAADAETLANAVIAARINGEITAMVSDYFAPDHRRRPHDAYDPVFSLL